MKNDDEQSSLILEVIGIISVIWFALLVAPYLSSGLMGILDGVPEAMNHLFLIQLCGDSVKTVLIFLLSYGMRIGIYLSTKKYYRRGEEYGSAKWGNNGTIDHVGIVESVSGGTVNTIEGNSGDKVARRNYSIGNSNIYGYGVPAY